MANRRAKADVVIVGLGWAGSIMAEELTRAGLEVVAIERGAWRDTSTDFPPAVDGDELRWAIRREILQPPAVEALTFRNNPQQQALPVRDWNCFQFGWNVGGAGTHWAGMSWRWLPWDFQPFTKTVDRYGRGQIDDGLLVQDWGITYDDLEPFYDRFEKIAGTSGKAGNLRGRIIKGGNPFEGPRQSEYPLPPLQKTRWMEIFHETTEKMGYHPFVIPAGNTSGAYTNPFGIKMAPCTYCGYCDFFGCGNWSKSSPQACVLPALMQRKNFTVVTESEVLRVNLAADGKTATGVTYIDSQGVEGEQPADIVILSAYQMDNVRLMLLSKIGTPYNYQTGEGTIGRSYSYQTCSGAMVFFENEHMNPFIYGGAVDSQIDDFNSDNFDHTGLGFIGGAGILANGMTGRPIARADTLAPGARRWGSQFKKDFRYAYQNAGQLFGQGTSMSHRNVFLDLDPIYKDRHGQPLLRVTFDWNENDKRMSRFISDRCVEIGKKMGAKHVVPFNATDQPNTPYDQKSSHTIGGAVMGEKRTTSALNRYLQSWDVHNVFVTGANAFPNNAGYNPTVTVGATTLWAAHAIKEQYLKHPGPLVEA